jgi:hypothetical protein
MSKPNPFIISMFLILLLGFKTACAQKWIADTVKIEVCFPDSTKTPVSIHKVNDLRLVEHNFISVFEKKKWLVFPVDQVVVSHQPLSKVLKNKLSTPETTNPTFDLDIQQFTIHRTPSWFKTSYKLYASIGLQNPTTKTITGSLHYEMASTKSNKISTETAYLETIQQWGQKFTADLYSVSQGTDTLIAGSLPSFRRGALLPKNNFYIETEFFGGLHFRGMDAALWFSEPEGAQIFNRSIRMIRYVEHPNVRAIALGRDVIRWNYRINNNWLFDNKFVLLFGINNWKDLDTVSHKLEEILYMNASLTQRISLNQRDKSGLVFGIGIIEDVHYIIYHRVKLNVGISLSCAYKF